MLVVALTVSNILQFKIFDFQQRSQDHGLQFSHWHRSMANVIEKIALCDLDLLFRGKNLNILYRLNGKSERNNVRETFVDFDISYGMVLLLKLHFVTLT